MDVPIRSGGVTSSWQIIARSDPPSLASALVNQNNSPVLDTVSLRSDLAAGRAAPTAS